LRDDQRSYKDRRRVQVDRAEADLQLPKGLDSIFQSSLKRLQSESGTRFDRTYAAMTLKEHQQA
jgi:predicted outer membrane protein